MVWVISPVSQNFRANQVPCSKLKEAQKESAQIRLRLNTLLSVLLLPFSSAHGVFEGAFLDFEAKVVADPRDAVSTGAVAFAIVAFRFDDQGRCFASHDFAVA